MPLRLKQIVVCNEDLIKSFLSHPAGGTQPAAIINVSDTPCELFNLNAQLLDIRTFWFPINECGSWGWSPFFAAAKVIDFFKDSNRKIIIHCHAGANRSPCVAYAILLSEGFSEEEVNGYLGIKKLFDINVNRGNIPGNIVEFLKLRHEYPSYSMMGLLNKIDPENKYGWICEKFGG